MNYNRLCFFDYETVARKGEKAYNPLQAEPIQLAAKIIDPRKLEVVPGAVFGMNDTGYICPPFPREQMDQDVLNWHSKNSGKTPEELLDIWYAAPSQKQVHTQFIEFLDRYHKQTNKKSIHSAPILCGQNIIKFDNVIFDRLCERYGFIGTDGKQNIYRDNLCVDTLNILWPWFENNPDVNSLSMDKLRPYFGMSSVNAHNAEKDIDDGISILCRFLRFHRKIAEKTSFEGAFTNGDC